MIEFSLTHRCTVTGRVQDGVDRLNRPVFTSGPPQEDIACFFSSKNTLNTDANGDSYVRVITLLLSKRADVTLESKVSDIRMGSVVINGIYEVIQLVPVSGYKDLSHYELTLREVK